MSDGRLALGGERGTGSVLAIGLVGAIVSLTMLLAPLVAISVARHRATAAADSSALAAADVAIGLEPGVPCTVAAEIALTNGATLANCQADGVIVTVRVRVAVLGLSVSSTATAGPPPHGG